MSEKCCESCQRFDERPGPFCTLTGFGLATPHVWGKDCRAYIAKGVKTQRVRFLVQWSRNAHLRPFPYPEDFVPANQDRCVWVEVDCPVPTALPTVEGVANG